MKASWWAFYKVAIEFITPYNKKNNLLRNVTIWRETDQRCKFTFQISSNYFQECMPEMIIYSSQVQFAITLVKFLLHLCRCEREKALPR